jgi:methionyl-tRNA formyltransferase
MSTTARRARDVVPDDPGDVYADSAYRGRRLHQAAEDRGGRARVVATHIWARNDEDAQSKLKALNGPIHKVRGRIEKVYDLIRGTNPAPGAWTRLDGEEVGIFDCARVAGDGVSGKVMTVSDEGVSVQCVGGRILVKRVRPKGQDKQPAAEWACQASLQPGQVLGS